MSDASSLRRRIKALLEKEHAYRSPTIDTLHSVFTRTLQSYFIGATTSTLLSALADEVLFLLLRHEDALAPTMELVDALILSSQLPGTPSGYGKQAIHRQLRLFLADST